MPWPLRFCLTHGREGPKARAMGDHDKALADDHKAIEIDPKVDTR